MRVMILGAVLLTSCGLGPPPCADGTWAGWENPRGVIWVSPDGDDDNSGKSSAPLQTIQAALQATRGVADARVGLFPGTYPGEIQLKRIDQGALTLSGCSAEESILQGAAYPVEVVATLAGPGAMTLRRVSTLEGAAGVALVGGVTATVEDVVVSSAKGRGVSIVGASTRATLRRVQVDATRDAHHSRPHGWGLAIHHAAVMLEDVTITDSGVFGIFASEGATLTGSGVTVRDVTHNVEGHHGIGIYANQLAELSLSGCVVEDVYGAGIFAIDTPTVSVSGCTIQTVTESRSGGGDGLVIRRVGASGSAHTAHLTDNTVTGADRMGIALVGDISARLSGNIADASSGLSADGTSIYATSDVSLAEGSAHPLDLTSTPVGRLYLGEDVPRGRGGGSHYR